MVTSLIQIFRGFSRIENEVQFNDLIAFGFADLAQIVFNIPKNQIEWRKIVKILQLLIPYSPALVKDVVFNEVFITIQFVQQMMDIPFEEGIERFHLFASLSHALREYPIYPKQFDHA